MSNRHFLIGLLTVLLIASSRADEAPAPAAPQGYRDTLLVLDQQFWEASARGDAGTIGRLVADDYLGIDQDQHRWTRAALLEQYRAVHTSDLTRSGEPEVLRLTDHSAVLTYEAAYKVHYGGGESVNSGLLRMSSCWVQRDGGWFVVFSQVSAVDRTTPDPSAAAAAVPAEPPALAPQPLLDLPRAPVSGAPADDVEHVVALQDSARATFAVGEVIRFDITLRNATDRVLDGHFSTERAFYDPPVVADADGMPVKVSPPTAMFSGVWALLPYHLGPGDEKAMGTTVLTFNPDGPAPEASAAQPRLYSVAHAGPGKYHISYFGSRPIEVEIHK